MTEPIAIECDGLVKFLEQQPEVIARVGAAAASRIYPSGGLPEAGPWPAITYQLVSSLPRMHMTGRSSLEFARVQLDCFSPEYGDGRSLSLHVAAALNGYRGLMGVVTVHSAAVEGPRHLRAGKAALHQFQLDVLLWYRQT
ncbi:MAG TPA: DUF3168 domain-containing protein [Vicinamibacterales bacterium]|nr:DUF3168 domain-containing protein [Vicinamibacterales bacterium]